jgi:hypothetical protein
MVAVHHVEARSDQNDLKNKPGFVQCNNVFPSMALGWPENMKKILIHLDACLFWFDEREWGTHRMFLI